MRKQDILEQANAEGIELTQSTLDRYIKYGFLKGEKKDAGYKQIPVTTYPEAMTIIQYVDHLKQMPHIKYENIIFVLFGAGLPIDIDKLRNLMIRQRQTVMNQFQEIADHISDIEQARFIANDLAKTEMKSVRKPGRPSEQIKNKEAEWSEKFNLMLLFIKDLVQKNTLSERNALDWIKSFPQHIPVDSSEIKEIILKHINYSDWMQQSRYLETENYVHIQEIMTLAKKYYAGMEGPEASKIKESVERINESLGYDFLWENPALIYLILFVLLASGKYQVIKTILSNP
ncbi:hypothetical protein ACWGPW_22445 [Paenibacillus chitinolyticus]